MTSLLRPLRVGSARLPNNVVLSPMAGFSDLPFRRLCREAGAGLVCTEMVAAPALERGAGPALVRMQTAPEERPTSIQLVGTEVDEVAHAAATVAPMCDIVGLNMGCPAYQVASIGCGAALLDRPEHAEALVAAMRRATDAPLLVKMRAGNVARVDAAGLARRLEAAGVDGFIVHARTAAEGYRGRADWTIVRDVKRAVRVPVIGNGDVTDGPSAAAALEASGADGVAIGRAALGDPHVFHRITRYLDDGETVPAAGVQERCAALVRYLELADGSGLGHQHVLEQAQKFARGLPGAARLRSGFKGEVALDEVRERFVRFAEAAG